MEALDAAFGFSSMFPPTPPSSASSPSLADTSLWSGLTAPWEDGGLDAGLGLGLGLAANWTLDGLPDVKPDVNEMLQASLRTDAAELPVLNADSTNFLLDGDVQPVLAAAPAAPWLPQWSYCAYCAAQGGGVPCEPQPQPALAPQDYNQPFGQDTVYAQPEPGLVFDSYLAAPMAPVATLGPTFDGQGLGLVYVDGLSAVPDDLRLEPEGLRWGPASAIGNPPAPADVVVSPASTMDPGPAPECQGKSGKRSRLTSSRDPLICGK